MFGDGMSLEAAEERNLMLYIDADQLFYAHVGDF